MSDLLQQIPPLSRLDLQQAALALVERMIEVTDA